MFKLAAPLNQVNKFKIKDPYLINFIYKYEKLISWKDVKSIDDINKQIDILVENLRNKIDPESPTSNYMKDIDLEKEFQQNANNPQVQEAYRMYTQDPEKAKQAILKHVNDAKYISFTEWWNYVTGENDIYEQSPAFQFMVLKPIFDSSPAENKMQPFGLNANALAMVYQKLGEGKQDTGILKIYDSAIQQAQLQSSQVVKQDTDKSGWIKIPGIQEDPKHFEENVEKLKNYSIMDGNTWCTGSGNAAPYLQQGNFFLYIENGLPKVAIRTVGQNIAEIKGVKNTVPFGYEKRILEFLPTTELNYKECQDYKNLFAIQELNEKLEINNYDLSQTTGFDSSVKSIIRHNFAAYRQINFKKFNDKNKEEFKLLLMLSVPYGSPLLDRCNQLKMLMEDFKLSKQECIDFLDISSDFHNTDFYEFFKFLSKNNIDISKRYNFISKIQSEFAAELYRFAKENNNSYEKIISYFEKVSKISPIDLSKSLTDTLSNIIVYSYNVESLNSSYENFVKKIPKAKNLFRRNALEALKNYVKHEGDQSSLQTDYNDLHPDLKNYPPIRSLFISNYWQSSYNYEDYYKGHLNSFSKEYSNRYNSELSNLSNFFLENYEGKEPKLSDEEIINVIKDFLRSRNDLLVYFDGNVLRTNDNKLDSFTKVKIIKDKYCKFLKSKNIYNAILSKWINSIFSFMETYIPRNLNRNDKKIKEKVAKIFSFIPIEFKKDKEVFNAFRNILYFNGIKDYSNISNPKNLPNSGAISIRNLNKYVQNKNLVNSLQFRKYLQQTLIEEASSIYGLIWNNYFSDETLRLIFNTVKNSVLFKDRFLQQTKNYIYSVMNISQIHDFCLSRVYIFIKSLYTKEEFDIDNYLFYSLVNDISKFVQSVTYEYVRNIRNNSNEEEEKIEEEKIKKLLAQEISTLQNFAQNNQLPQAIKEAIMDLYIAKDPNTAYTIEYGKVANKSSNLFKLAQYSPLNKKLLTVLNGDIKVFSINKDFFKNHLDTDFWLSGSHNAYPNIIPPNQIWLSNNLSKQEMERSIIQEYQVIKNNPIKQEKEHRNTEKFQGQNKQSQSNSSQLKLFEENRIKEPKDLNVQVMSYGSSEELSLFINSNGKRKIYYYSRFPLQAYNRLEVLLKAEAYGKALVYINALVSANKIALVGSREYHG